MRNRRARQAGPFRDFPDIQAMWAGWGGQAGLTVLLPIWLVCIHMIGFFAYPEGFVRQCLDDRQPYFIAQRDKKRHTGVKVLFEFGSFSHRASSFLNGLKI